MPKQQEKIQPAGVVFNRPRPALPKADEYLKSYQNYVYTATSAIAQEVASIELKLLKKTKDEVEEVKEHEALSLLHFANSLTTQYDLIESTQTYSELIGEAFWVVFRDNNKRPREIWPLRPDWVKVIPSPTDVIDHYIYNPGGISTEKVKIPRENMVPFRYFNPTNPYRGKGSVQAAAMPIDIFDFAQQHNRNFFFNSAEAGLVFLTDKVLKKEVIDRFTKQWQSTYGGRENAHKIAFLGGGFKMEKSGTTAKEMDFANLHRIMRDDILAVFKVPKTVLGLTEDVNRANAEATTRAFMERVITPRMRKFVNTLNEFYLPMFGETELFFDFEDPAPEDVEKKLLVYENGLKYGWLTPNEVREMENLDSKEGGDDLRPASVSLDEVQEMESQIEEVTKNVKGKEKEILTTANKQGATIIEESKKQAEAEKKAITEESKGLRDKVKGFINDVRGAGKET